MLPFTLLIVFGFLTWGAQAQSGSCQSKLHQSQNAEASYQKQLDKCKNQLKTCENTTVSLSANLTATMDSIQEVKKQTEITTNSNLLQCKAKISKAQGEGIKKVEICEKSAENEVKKLKNTISEQELRIIQLEKENSELKSAKAKQELDIQKAKISHATVTSELKDCREILDIFNATQAILTISDILITHPTTYFNLPALNQNQQCCQV